ncbi:ATP-binding cassette domain-containing protein, partial [Acinetobacter baumannii]
WALQLSGGEQQRIALARALIQRPAWLFLDESTSAIDEASETAIYRTLRERLPGTTIVSIGHRENLKPLHDKVMRLVPREDGGAPALVPAG